MKKSIDERIAALERSRQEPIAKVIIVDGTELTPEQELQLARARAAGVEPVLVFDDI